MGKKGDLSNFERGMVVGARQADLNISQSAQLLGFSRTTIYRVLQRTDVFSKAFVKPQHTQP